MKFTMKKTLFLKTLMLSAATVALFGMTACSGSDDNIIGDEPITEQPGTVKTYQVSIPATMPGDEQTRAVSFDGTTSTSTFKAGEKVYVYNVTKNEVMEGYLQPSNITTDGKGCDLTGTLTGGTISNGDNLKLMYNLTSVNTNKEGDIYKYYTKFNYDGQNGTQASVLDGALATVNVSSYTGGTLTTTAPASFQPVQSMFRFQFVDESGAPITVKTLRIQSTNLDISDYYWPLDNNSPFGANNIMVTPLSPTSDYLYVAICIREDETPSALEFTVTDDSDNEYKGTKDAPSGGFKNGKYYYNTSAITLTKQAARIEPTITWNNESAVSPDVYNRYNVYATEITLSGTSKGYYFWMYHGGTIHLSGLTATYDDDNFIYSNGDLTLDISGANSITTKNFWLAIFVDGTLKLSGSGTLTLTVNDADGYGIMAISNYNYAEETNSDASVLAADGYTVTRSDVTNNGNGTYSVTYTVGAE